MPEGDTIHRAARSLRAALAGKRITRLEAPADPSIAAPAVPHDAAGATVTAVEAHGKHLTIRFDDGRALRTHMGMPGSWHLYRHGERWRRSARRVRALIETDDVVAVCFAAPVAELLAPSDVRRSEHTRRLGPDLIADDDAPREAVRRLGALDPATDVGVALLDQRVAAGIGNIWRCEAMFACRVHPWTAIADLDDDTRLQLYATAARMLRESVAQGRGGDRPKFRASVYRRNGQPCRRCGTLVAAKRQGPMARVTYWCDSCQRATSAGEV